MKNLISVVLCVTLLSSCGVITKSRYGNGVKIDMGNGLFAKKEKTEELKAEKAVKLGKANKEEPIANASPAIINAENMQKDTIENSFFKTQLVHFANKNIKIKPKYKVAKTHVVKKSNDYEVPVEPHAEIAAWLFYGGLVGLLIPFVNILAGLAMIAGFVLAIIALVKISDSEYQLRGKGIAISIIIVFPLIIILSIFLIYLILFALLI